MKKPENLDDLIEEAIIDAYDDDECRTGFLTMLDEHIAMPFMAKIAGSEIRVTSFDVDDYRIFVRCERDGMTYSLDVLDIEPTTETQGIEWIAAYRQWCRGANGVETH